MCAFSALKKRYFLVKNYLLIFSASGTGSQLSFTIFKYLENDLRSQTIPLNKVKTAKLIMKIKMNEFLLKHRDANKMDNDNAKK